PRESGGTAFGWASHNGIPLIWSLSEPEGARDWWPCKDRPVDKADSIDVLLRGPEGFVLTSNGLLVEEIPHEDGSRTYHWKHTYPISTYLVSVTGTVYERIEDRYVSAEGDTMLIEHFVYPDKLAQAQEDLSITAPAIAVFADRYGPYPFIREKYGHALFPWRGAMEHQTNTSYGGMLITGGHNYDWILVHELAHQWWGDMTSPADWRDIWLNEGFASHAEALWFEHLGGPSAYRDYMVGDQAVWDPSGPLYDPRYLFDSNTIYNKGAWAVHMLRGVLGDSLFYDVLAAYRAATEYRSTTTEEFQSIAEQVGGRSLDWFFDSWIYGVDRPRYEVSYLPLGDPTTPSVAIHIAQKQQTAGFFTMPLDLEIALDGGGAVRKRIWNDPDHIDFEFELDGPAIGVTVDPDRWVLCHRETAPYGLNITTTDLLDGVAGQLYAATLVGRGGSPPYAWEVDRASPLPDSLALDQETGVLSGSAPDSGVYAFTIKLWDRLGKMDRQSYRWAVGT
ncbi:MAG: M1 family metallopeptidase, partial [Candidatus Eisenbacteria bacterium]|nr:M1 family metallopeptidase [Candidatus Eisenbacteria bacterium]